MMKNISCQNYYFYFDYFSAVLRILIRIVILKSQSGYFKNPIPDPEALKIRIRTAGQDSLDRDGFPDNVFVVVIWILFVTLLSLWFT